MVTQLLLDWQMPQEGPAENQRRDDYKSSRHYAELDTLFSAWHHVNLIETLRLAGAPFNMLMASHVCNSVCTGLVYTIAGMIHLKLHKNPIAPNTNALWFFLLFDLHFGSLIAFAMVISYLPRSNNSTLTTILILACISILSALIKKLPESTILLLLTGLLPNVPIKWFWTEVYILEINGYGVTFKNALKFRGYVPRHFSVSVSFLMLYIQTVMYVYIAVYLNNVTPGPFGIVKPWCYCLQRSKTIESDMMDDDEMEKPEPDPLYFEEPPTSEVGIRIKNVTKIFGRNRALNNVSFDVYRGEITVLLGHNGAGKTTLMSIITGTIEMTSGQVYVNGHNVKDRSALQKNIGFCTQHNHYIPELTVRDHIKLFAMLRGKTLKQAKEDANKLLVQLNMQKKANVRGSKLSGGMLRRLQIGMALAGDASVLILDEPTSGLDVETRREQWNTFLALRGNRTVVLSTHFMEEADALGDRVVALQSGIVKCHATPMFLKKGMGTGYRLTLTTEGKPKQDEIESVVKSVVSAASLKEKTYNSLAFSLPSKDSSRFPTLFTRLENQKADLEIASIGVGVSTLEEVFLKLCRDDVKTSLEDEEIDKILMSPPQKKITGFKLCKRQFWALFRRQLAFYKINKMQTILMNILTLICLFLLANWLINIDTNYYEYDPSTAMLPNARRSILYDFDPKYIEPFKAKYKEVKFRRMHDSTKFDDVALEFGKYGLKNSDYMVGLYLNDTDATILYTTSVSNAIPMGINMLSNVLASRMMGILDDGTIVTRSEPLSGTAIKNKLRVVSGHTPQNLGTYNCLTFFLIMVLVSTVMIFHIRERVSGIRHVHMLSGCSPWVIWGSAFFTHALFYCFFLLIPTTLTVFFDVNNHTLTQADYIGVFFFLMLEGTLSYLVFCYYMSFFLSETTASVINVCMLSMALLASEMVNAVDVSRALDKKMLEQEFFHQITITIDKILVIVYPPSSAMLALNKAASIASSNAFCKLNRHMCPYMVWNPDLKGFNAYRCCADEYECYLCGDDSTLTTQVMNMVIQFCVYTLLVWLKQAGVFSKDPNGVLCCYSPPEIQRYQDVEVEKEKLYVNEQFKKPIKSITDTLLLQNINKTYIPLCCAVPYTAVNDISWSVKKGECFGLLGVNGAGKTTTFNTITGNTYPTQGRLFCNGYLHGFFHSKYMQSMAYCPQFFEMDPFLTGKANLELLLTLRGLNSADVAAEAQKWIEIVGLEKYKDKLQRSYSGGCARRLGTAAALSSGAPLVLLDEPTSGVDVSARRRVWVAMRCGLNQQQSIIITSHSTDEMEALCDRIAILSAGELAALGSPAMLRAQHAAGHTLVFKITPHLLQPNKDVPAVVAELKQNIRGRFNCKLKDEHQTMLKFHIRQTMSYSKLFNSLEDLKAKFPQLIEDYSATETTLEEVFLSFAHGDSIRTQNIKKRTVSAKKQLNKKK